MKYLILIAVALFGAAQASVEYDRPCRTAEMSPRVKTGFQVAAYLGTWYEIRRYEAANQTGFDCAMARYSANLDGTVQVRNSGYFQGRNIEFVGTATLAFPEQVPLPAKLTVVFAPGRKF
jgi:lipocalin